MTWFAIAWSSSCGCDGRELRVDGKTVHLSHQTCPICVGKLQNELDELGALQLDLALSTSATEPRTPE